MWPEHTTYKPGATIATIGGHNVEFSIIEVTKRVLTPPPPPPPARRGAPPSPPASPRYEFKPTGRLRFRAGRHYTGHQVEDAVGSPLEGRVNEILTSLLDEADRERQLHIEHERWREEYRRAAERRERAEKRRELETQRVLDLSTRVSDWRTALDVRAFALAVQRWAEQSVTDRDGLSRIADWLVWARERAENLERQAVETILEPRNHDGVGRKASDLVLDVEGYRLRDLLTDDELHDHD
jgi:hypothetical protein